jgi:predicted nucleic acid-binding protein
LKARVSATALDSSVIVAGLLTWHQHHEDALQALEEVCAEDRAVILPLPVLLEAYSVMTRLPAPHRLSPNHALGLLEDSPLKSCSLVGLPSEEGWTFVRSLALQGIAGGRAYDALVAACAKRGGARHILTINRRHFEGLDPEIEVLSPL